MSFSSSSIASVPSDRYGPITLEELGESHPLQRERYHLLGCLDGVEAPFGDIPHTSAALAKIVADYAQQSPVLFGPHDYRTYYGVDVGGDVLPEEDLQWWNSLDAITPFDAQNNPTFNYETHHGFHYIPAKCKPLTDRIAQILGVRVGEEIPMDLEKHDLFAREPEEGHPSRFEFETRSLRQIKTMQSATSCWVAIRKGVLFRTQTTVRQRALMKELNTETEAQMQAMGTRLGTRYGILTGTRYENLPDARELSLIARNHLVKTGERILGDNTGYEGCLTYSRTEQQVTFEDKDEAGEVVSRQTYQIDVGGQTPVNLGVVGGSRPSGGLLVGNRDFGVVSIGVAGLRKSSGHRPLEH